MKVSFKFPMKVNKVNFTNLNQETYSLGLRDIHDMDSLNKVAQQWITTATTTNQTGPGSGENGTADCDFKKRKVVWTINNFKGGQNKTLEVCLTYDKDVLIDEF